MWAQAVLASPEHGVGEVRVWGVVWILAGTGVPQRECDTLPKVLHVRTPSRKTQEAGKYRKGLSMEKKGEGHIFWKWYHLK